MYYKQKKSKCERVGQIPFGKQLSKDRITLVDNEQEMKVIKLVMWLRRQGMSYQKIADYLTIRGLKNKSGNVKWNGTQIFRIIKNHNMQSLLI